MLHRIAQQSEPNTGKASHSHLRACLNYLADNDYTFISLEKLILSLKNHQKLPPKSVVFTMDDGYLDQAEIAAPIFLEYNCPLTFFVVTGMLDQIIWPWDAQVSWIIESSIATSLHTLDSIKRLNITVDENINKRELRRLIQATLKKMDAEAIPDILQQLAHDAGVSISHTPPHSYQPMTWQMARTLEQQGIRFAPHSVNHNILSQLSQKSMEQEINQSWQIISSELDDPLKVFCYPNGTPIDFGAREIKALKKAGYLGAMSTTPDFVRNEKNSRDNIYSLPRFSLPDNMTDFIQYCSWMEGIRRRTL